ncbi:hypothetical protein OC846_006330 [Tilletia horrida]|uniref:Peptidase M23 domain-containing protein n=1 Tax=Tilletia horrida TaxID=155126 RepID=A0AAN6GNV6_9BASI|nr:hypothetical protein OC846_006330 [Tilletia horrida]KAK0560008.1 hypothetical protein OC861_006445 [Tilletia horrida]
MLMISALLAAVLSASALTGPVQVAPLDPLSQPPGNLSCSEPVYLANLKVVRAPSFKGDTVAFTSARDTQGRLQLSTSVRGIKTPAYPQFLFRPCNSTILPTGPYAYQEATSRYYGFLIPNWHRNKCITYAGDLYSSTPASFVSADCHTADTPALASQWWGVDVGFLAGTTTHIAGFYGENPNDGRNGSYHISVENSGSAQVVQAAWGDDEASWLGYSAGELHFQIQNSIYRSAAAGPP